MPQGAAATAWISRAQRSTPRAEATQRHWRALSPPLVTSADGFRHPGDVGHEAISAEGYGQDLRDEAERPEAPFPDFLAVHHADVAGPPEQLPRFLARRLAGDKSADVF